MNQISTDNLDEFEVLKLENAFVSVQVVPQCGAKIISLKDRRADREWLWHPGNELKLFSNSLGDPFSQSPLSGIDECLPTIIAGEMNQRKIPDHGEVWSQRWDLDQDLLLSGKIRTTIDLPLSPLRFSRELSLFKNQILMEYRLENRSNQIERYLWSFHPLFAYQPGDRLIIQNQIDQWKTILTSSPMRLPVGDSLSWSHYPEVISLKVPSMNDLIDPFYIKGFLNATGGRAQIIREGTNESLLLEWDEKINPYLGYFLNSKGWNGYSHWALEPTNFPHDCITSEFEGGDLHHAELSPGEIRHWNLRLTLGS